MIRPSPALTTGAILAKTYYNVHGHQPESVDWFNVLFAQTIAQLRSDAQQDNAILTSLSTLLNGGRKPEFLDEIKVTEINLGEEFPIFSNVRIIPVEDAKDVTAGGRLQARMDVDLSDAITLGIETKLVLNYPRPRIAVMPVALAVSIVRFSGTLSISFIPSPSPSAYPTTSGPPHPSSSTSASTTTRPTSAPASFSNLSHLNHNHNHDHTQASSPDQNPADPTPPTTLTFSFLPDYRLELSTHSLLGSRSRLQDIPKIAQLVEARLHDWFDERCVEPRFQQVVLPSMWPRRKNTRGGDVEVENAATEQSKPNKEDADSRPSAVGKEAPLPKLPGSFGEHDEEPHNNSTYSHDVTRTSNHTARSQSTSSKARSSATDHTHHQPQPVPQPRSQQPLRPTTPTRLQSQNRLHNRLASPAAQLRQRYSAYGLPHAYEGEVQSSPLRNDNVDSHRHHDRDRDQDRVDRERERERHEEHGADAAADFVSGHDLEQRLRKEQLQQSQQVRSRQRQATR